MYQYMRALDFIIQTRRRSKDTKTTEYSFRRKKRRLIHDAIKKRSSTGCRCRCTGGNVSYRLQRLSAFLDPWSSPLEEGYQLLQSYYGLGSGGLFGVGLFNSRQKYLFLPFSESDFIFSVIGEELGLIGCMIVIAAFCFMIYRLIVIAQNAADRFGCYLSAGMAVLIGVQVLINIAVVTGCIPPTGIPLPFVSSGSSALITFSGGIGMCQSVRLGSHASVRALI